MQFNPNLINVNSNTNTSSYGGSVNGAQTSAGKATDVLNENVKRGVGQATGASSSGLQLNDKKSAEDVADTMLSFVQRGLDQLRERGADEGRIQQRLESAKEGIAKGYAQAEQQLKDMGLLSDELKSDIAKGRDLIESGLGNMALGLPVTNTQTSASSLSAASNSSSVYSNQVGQKNAMSLELMTKDGDKISLSFTQSAQTSSYRSNSSSESGTQQIDASSFQQGTAWQMDVVGNLDEGEQAALSNLLKDVEKLSATFFGGDLGLSLIHI